MCIHVVSEIESRDSHSLGYVAFEINREQFEALSGLVESVREFNQSHPSVYDSSTVLSVSMPSIGKENLNLAINGRSSDDNAPVTIQVSPTHFCFTGFDRNNLEHTTYPCPIEILKQIFTKNDVNKTETLYLCDDPESAQAWHVSQSKSSSSPKL